MKKKAVAKRTAAVKTETSSKRPPRQKESGLGQVHDAAVVLNTITPPAPAMHADVRQRAMLVNLTVHQWLANTTDKKITNEVANIMASTPPWAATKRPCSRRKRSKK
jgi:hypothetical protein